MLSWIFEKGSTPILEQAMKFSESRHKYIASNIANADTPGYRRMDLDKGRFHQLLERAIDDRSNLHPASFEMSEDLHMPMDDRGQFLPGRWLDRSQNEGPLKHDNNNVSVEREMVQMVKNKGVYTKASALLSKQLHQIRAAITENASGS